MIWMCLVVFLLAALVATLVTPLTITLSHRLRLLDEPDARKVHASATPRLGGIGIFAGVVIVGIPAFLIASSWPDGGRVATNPHLALVLGASFVFVVGLLDDIAPVSSRYKLIALLAASAVVCGSGGALGDLRFSGNSFVEFHWLSWLVTVVWIAGFAVAFNFIDGLDGLAGGLAVLCSVTLAYFLLDEGCFVAAIAPLALAGALIGFLRHNWNPAKTFMGDGGSLSVGFLLGAMTIISNPAVGTMRSMFVPGLALSVAFVDTALTLFRRRYEQRRSMFAAERGHIHHRLLDRGFSHVQTVQLIHAVSIAAVLVGFFSLAFEGWATLGGISLLIPLLGVFFHFAGSMRTGDMVVALRRKREIDRTSRGFRTSFEALQLDFDQATNFSDWWQIVCHAAERLQFSEIELPIESPADGKQRTLGWVNPDDTLGAAKHRIDAKIPIPAMQKSGEAVQAEVKIPTMASLESAGERLALFSRLMAENGHQSLRRIHRVHTKTLHEDATGPGEFGALRVAIVHDFFYTYAGAERVVEQLVKMFPHCAVYGLFDFLPDDERGFLRGKSVNTTFIHKMPFAKAKHRAYLPLMPLAIEQLDLSGFDLVISSSYLVAKGVITGPDQLHICYCHSPVRYGWDLQHQYLNEAGLGYGPRGMAARALLHYLRNWDARSSLGVDHFVANSQFVARRIAKAYRREAEVVPPPVDTESFVPDPPTTSDSTQAFYLAASRLVSYKRMDLIVEAFTSTPDRRLVVIGDGPEMDRLRAVAGPNVELLGYRDRDTLIDHMQRAKAFVFAAEEDFGIVPVEAMACGTPVIALGKGGVTESVAEGPTGYFFKHQTVPSLLDAIDRFEKAGPIDEVDRNATRQRAERFSNAQFVERLTDVIRKHVNARWPERLQAMTDPAQTDEETTVAFGSGAGRPADQASDTARTGLPS